MTKSVFERRAYLVDECRRANVFACLAECLWAKGEDGEGIAREMAHALEAIIIEARISVYATLQTTDVDVMAEIKRLLAMPKPDMK
jgi:hypothetical protein